MPPVRCAEVPDRTLPAAKIRRPLEVAVKRALAGIAAAAITLGYAAPARPQSRDLSVSSATTQGEARPELATGGRAVGDGKPSGAIALDPHAFGAVGDGLVDDTAAMAATLDAARDSGGPIGGVGLFRIDGTLDIAGVRFVTSNSYSRGTVDPRKWGFVLEHNSAQAPLFQPSACGGVLDGVVLYDPRQTGTGPLPVTRPPMFRFTGKCTDFTVRNSVVVNAYDVFEVTRSGVIGDWRLNGNRIFAVRYVFNIEGAMPEALAASDNIYSAGVFERSAVYGNGGMLMKWTSLNGAWMIIDTAERSVDGVKSSNEIVFGYRNWLKIVSGRLDVSNVSNPSWDGVLQPIDMSGNAGIGLTVTGGHTFGYARGVPSAAAPAFRIGGSGVRNLSIVGHQLLMASASALSIEGRGAGLVEWRGGEVYDWGRATGAAGSVGVTVDAPRTDFSFKPARVVPSTGARTCVEISDARTIDMGTIFSMCDRAFDVGLAPNLLAGQDTSLIVGATAAAPYTNNAGAKFVARGSYGR